MASIGHNSKNSAFDLIDVRRSIITSKKSSYAKFIALVIVEHMTVGNLSAFPGKTRLARLCSMSDSTFERYWEEAQSFFTVVQRRGMSSVFHAMVEQTSEELFALWEEKSRVRSNAKRAFNELRVVAGLDVPPPQYGGGSSMEPSPILTPPHIDPPSKGGGTPPHIDPPKSREESTETKRREREDEGCRGGAFNVAVAVGLASALAAFPVAAATPTEPMEMSQPSPSQVSYDYDQLMTKLMDAGGRAMANEAACPGLLRLSDVHGWLEQGCDLEKDIIPAIKSVAAKLPPARIKTWGYFTGAVVDAKTRRTAPLPVGQAQSKPPERKQFRSFADQEEDSHRAWLYRDAERMMALGPILPREDDD